MGSFPQFKPRRILRSSRELGADVKDRNEYTLPDKTYLKSVSTL